MSRKPRLVQCQCGCQKSFHTSHLTEVEICQALDAQGKQLEFKRVSVARECKEAYETELGLLKLMQGVLTRWAPKPKTFWQKLNFPRTMRLWWRRIGAAVEIMKTQHAIHERTKGFVWAKRHAVQSAILFGCPRFMQGFLARRFFLRAKRREVKENAARQELTTKLANDACAAKA